MSKTTKNLLRILSGLLTLLVAFFLRVKLFPQSSFATLESIGIHTKFLNQAIVSTATNLIDESLTGANLSGSLDQLSGENDTGAINTGVAIDMNHPENYFLIQLQKGTITTIDIYNRNNLFTPIRKISLPEFELISSLTDGIQYFNSHGEYYVITENSQYQDKTLFKVLLDGTIETISTGLKIGGYYVIDQEKKQIGYVMDTVDGGYENGITIYDIFKKTHKISSYDARKTLNTKDPTDDMRIIGAYSLKNGIIYFAVDHDGVDGNTQDFFTLCFDTETNKELSKSQCINAFPDTKRIGYLSNEQSRYDGNEPTLFIDKKEIGIFTGIEFTEIIGNYVFGKSSDGRKFYKLEDIISHNIKIKE